MFENVLRQIKQIIYRLKRNYGVSVVLVRLSDYTNNVKTGDMTQVKTDIVINRAILAPAKSTRDFVYDLSFIAANKNFTYGGYFDTSERVFIIDAKDLPAGFIPSLNDYIIYSGEKFNFKEISPVAEGFAYLMILKQVDAIPG